MMYKRILILLLFVFITSPVFSAGSSGGSSGGDAIRNCVEDDK